jgi:hypothetical protein
VPITEHRLDVHRALPTDITSIPSALCPLGKRGLTAGEAFGLSAVARKEPSLEGKPEVPVSGLEENRMILVCKLLAFHRSVT